MVTPVIETIPDEFKHLEEELFQGYQPDMSKVTMLEYQQFLSWKYGLPIPKK